MAHCWGATDPDETAVIAVAVDHSVEAWLAAADEHAARPAELVVIDVDPDAETAATTERPDGVTVSVVPESGDLTGIGIPLADHAARLRERRAAVTVCVDSASALLRSAPTEDVADFLGVLAGKVDAWSTGATGVRAHYHLAADAHDADTVEAVTAPMDVTVTLDEDGAVAGTRRVG